MRCRGRGLVLCGYSCGILRFIMVVMIAIREDAIRIDSNAR